MSDTPVMKQYQAIKAQYPGTLVLFRLGDFYEAFCEDAATLSQALGLVLTSRHKGENAVPMAGIPAKAIETYLPKLLQKDFKVAVCEQLQDASEAKGLVDRGVVRIVTPGTLTESEVLSDKHSNFLLSLHFTTKCVGMAWSDISTGQFIIHEVAPHLLNDELSRIAPVECLISEEARDLTIHSSDGTLTLEQMIHLQSISLSTKPNWYFDSLTGERILLKHFQVETLESYGCQNMKYAVAAAGALLKYIEETQKTNIQNLEKLTIYNAQDNMFLDRATRHCLEIQRSMRDGNRQGTLLSVLDRTCTAMGGRLLAEWIESPLINVDKIQARQQGIQELVDLPDIVNKLRQQLENIQDMERLCSRISYQRALAKDLLALKNSLQVIPGLQQLLTNSHSSILQETRQQLNALQDLTQLLDKAIHPDPKPVLKEGGIIRDGYNPELDELRRIQNTGNSWIQEFERREIQRTGIMSLKVGYCNDFVGYYIEVTHANSSKVPRDYIRKKTMKNAERYITAELKEYEDQIKSAEEKIIPLEYRLFVEVRDQVTQRLVELYQTAHAIAVLDVLANLAMIARERKYVCPKINGSLEIDIIAGRHPVLEVTLKEQHPFVPNDLRLGAGSEIAIITGPNMAGKSTYIRQAALLILMAQIGSFIPAESAQIGIVDRIFTRIGASDEIARGRSTFMVEMVETAGILNNATNRSFIALDEIGRGTSTFDGLSLAWAIVEYVQKKTKARTLFATHYHELVELSEIHSNIHNYNVAIQEYGENIEFMYKIVPGSTDKSYGIHVARLAGIPKEVIKRSREILSNLQRHQGDFQTYTKGCCRNITTKPPNAAATAHLFAYVGEEILHTLAHLDLNNLTPMEALQTLKELQAEAKKL